MTAVDWQIPPSVLAHLDRIPRDKPVVILLRHSVRDHLPPGEVGNSVPITDVGRRLAFDLGALFRGRLLRLYTSPVLRCMQTAEMLNAGAMTNHTIMVERLLGEPGVYVLDDELAWSNWQRLGHSGVMQHLVTSSEALPGMVHPDEAAWRLVRHMLDIAGDEPGLHVFVSHDLLVAATAARLLRKPFGNHEWPWFLEGAFFWQEGSAVHVVYREHECIRDAGKVLASTS